MAFVDFKSKPIGGASDDGFTRCDLVFQLDQGFPSPLFLTWKLSGTTHASITPNSAILGTISNFAPNSIHSSITSSATLDVDLNTTKEFVGSSTIHTTPIVADLKLPLDLPTNPASAAIRSTGDLTVGQFWTVVPDVKDPWRVVPASGLDIQVMQLLTVDGLNITVQVDGEGSLAPSMGGMDILSTSGMLFDVGPVEFNESIIWSINPQNDNAWVKVS